MKVLTIVVAAIIVSTAIGAIGNGGKRVEWQPPRESEPAVSRDGKWLAFIHNYGIYVAPARLGAVARRITHPGKPGDSEPEWSPDGSRIVFTRHWRQALMLYVVNRDGSGLRRLTKGDDWAPSAPSWSPDGRTIAFTNGQNVYAIDVNGTGKRLLLRNAQEPAWSPDGSKIAFVRGLEAIAVFDLKSKSIRRVIRSKLYATIGAPAFSRDGTRLAFEDTPEDTPVVLFRCCDEIYVVNVDGTGLRRLTRDKEIDGNPTWTPDGRIVFASDREGPSQLYAMNGDGTGVRRFVIERAKKNH